MHYSLLNVFLTHILLLLTIVSASDEITKIRIITRTVAFGTLTTTTSIPTSSLASPTIPPPPDSSMPGKGGGGPYSKAVFESAILNSTNYFRTRFLAEPMQWDSTLARFAHSHASTCIFEHSGGPYGENLAEGFRTPALGVDAWAAEEKRYAFPNGGFSESTGHFTQLVWQNTTHVGCAAVNCGRQKGENGAFGWYLVCEYDPPGNVIGQFRYNVRKPGESRSGKLGFGEMSGTSRLGMISIWMVVLVAASISVSV